MAMGMKPQKWSSLGSVGLTDTCTVYANEHSSIDMGLDYDNTVMLTCKLLFAATKAIVDIGPEMPRQS